MKLQYMLISLIFLIQFSFELVSTQQLSQDEIADLRSEAKSMFHHAYHSYMRHAFPADELKPLSCAGRNKDKEARGHLDDSLGDYSLTLVDSLSSLIVLGEHEELEDAVEKVIDNVRFDNDVIVSVFESTIRVLGGLLSAHVMIDTQDLIPWYRDELLYLAKDLADRLLPAFNTNTKIPFARVNLRHGVPKDETTLTCTACAGTLVLEFGLLSRLVGDDKYRIAAEGAVNALWERRSSLGLFGNLIDTSTGFWKERDSSIGAGIDSFYEYLLKSYFYFGNKDHYHMFNQTYHKILTYINHDNWYLNVDMHSGDTKYTWIDSLSAFWPGLQVIIGDVELARKAHDKYTSLWTKYGGVPERYDIVRGSSVQGINNYPLRPEFVESTYFLYRATKDHYYLQVGRKIMENLQKLKVPCGYASVADVETSRLEDRMDSYFLSETCKYLYLLFDDNNFLHKSPFIFTTEGHPLPLNLPWHRNPPSDVGDSCPFKKSGPLTNDEILSLLPKDVELVLPVCGLADNLPKSHNLKVSGIDYKKVSKLQVSLELVICMCIIIGACWLLLVVLT
eukprot:TRINITY_DN80_c0_g1_i6.p1 TRINITY_DN80_c0_g1~~TRINITY_DN80_c0_g1_i6.p1  ORF type:complete len:563 (-),score=78.30 TRINITY_DN80_c0_g1_i6:1510-3198(-)